VEFGLSFFLFYESGGIFFIFSFDYELRHSLLLAGLPCFLVDHFSLVTGVFMRVVLSQIFSFVL